MGISTTNLNWWVCRIFWTFNGMKRIFFFKEILMTFGNVGRLFLPYEWCLNTEVWILGLNPKNQGNSCKWLRCCPVSLKIVVRLMVISQWLNTMKTWSCPVSQCKVPTQHSNCPIFRVVFFSQSQFSRKISLCWHVLRGLISQTRHPDFHQ